MITAGTVQVEAVNFVSRMVFHKGDRKPETLINPPFFSQTARDAAYRWHNEQRLVCCFQFTYFQGCKVKGKVVLLLLRNCKIEREFYFCTTVQIGFRCCNLGLFYTQQHNSVQYVIYNPNLVLCNRNLCFSTTFLPPPPSQILVFNADPFLKTASSCNTVT